MVGGLRRAAAAVVVLVLAGCGVPDSGPARTVAPEDVPYGLLSQRPTPSSPDRGQSSGSGPSAYFVRDDRLVGVRLDNGQEGGQVQLSKVLAALSAGPTSAEQNLRTGTAIPPGLRLGVLALGGGRADIELSGETAHPDVAQNPLAAGQIVLTATSVSGVDSVRLLHDGQNVGPVLPDGTLATHAVTAMDYHSLLDPTTITSTATITATTTALPMVRRRRAGSRRRRATR